MTRRLQSPRGVPCWADLWTSDVAGARTFYPELLGWEAQEPSSDFGGYFMFTRQGVPVAGGLGDMGNMRASNSWRVYLATDAIRATVEAASAAGALVILEPTPVGDLGWQAVLQDPGGIPVSLWQPETFQGFSVLDEPGAPCWFELWTRDYAASLAFYQSVFSWQMSSISDSDQFRYAVMRNPDGDGQLAGAMDARTVLPEGSPGFWSVYWEVADVDLASAKVSGLGGAVVRSPEDSPYGRLATVADTSGVEFRVMARAKR